MQEFSQKTNNINKPKYKLADSQSKINYHMTSERAFKLWRYEWRLPCLQLNAKHSKNLR